MRAKRVIAAAMACLMVFSVTGCKSKTAKKAKEEQKEVFKIATDTTFAPFEYEDKNGKRVGIDLELFAAIADQKKIKYEIQAVGFDAAMASVESGQSDGMIAGMSITDQRKQKYDFSDSYYRSKVCFAVKKGSKIKAYKDLKGKTVVAKVGTVGAIHAEKMAKKYKFKVKQIDASPTMYQEVTSGNAVACFEDYPVMYYSIHSQNVKLQIAYVSNDGSDYGFAVKKGENQKLLNKFNDGLKKIKQTGKYQQIIDKYAKVD